MRQKLAPVFAAVVIGVGGMASAETEDGHSKSDLKAEVQKLREQVQDQAREIDRLRAKTEESWLNERRAEQVKTLVRDVLKDSETRASFQGEGLTAGWDDHPFIASENKNFRLEFRGQVQTRYIYNSVEFDPPVSRRNQEGFALRRAKLGFFGHVYDPKLQYGLSVRHDEGDLSFGDVGQGGEVDLENAWLSYELADGLTLKGGQFKAPFLREEAVDSSRQLAVERSYLADLFTVDYTQGAQLALDAETMGLPIRLKGMIHDGSYAANSNFTAGPGPGGPFGGGTEGDFAVAARGEVRLAGEWEQFDDFTTLGDDSLGVMLGAGVDYEKAEGGTRTTRPDVLKWTADVSVEVPQLFYGANGFVAVVGNHIGTGSADRAPTAGAVAQADQLGVVTQAGAFVIPRTAEVFFRWAWMDLDGASPFGARLGNLTTPPRFGDTVGPDHEISMLTYGTNYYFQEHNAKATVDASWIFDPIPVGMGNTGAGIVRSPQGDNQVMLRAQVQLLF